MAVVAVKSFALPRTLAALEASTFACSAVAFASAIAAADTTNIARPLTCFFELIII